jgi:predicted metal-dependent peptidase
VLGEVDAIRRSCACELTVLQFDATIHAKAEFSRWSEQDAQIGSTKAMRFFGRGGTDLRLPFTWAENERCAGRSISALIVCTDGYGPLPPRAPEGLPVLFLLTRTHSAPAFGEQVVLSG